MRFAEQLEEEREDEAFTETRENRVWPANTTAAKPSDETAQQKSTSVSSKGWSNIQYNCIVVLEM